MAFLDRYAYIKINCNCTKIETLPYSLKGPDLNCRYLLQISNGRAIVAGELKNNAGGVVNIGGGLQNIGGGLQYIAGGLQ